MVLMEKANFLKRFIGIAEFRNGLEVINFLKNIDSTQDFTRPDFLLLTSNDDFKLWLAASKSHVFIVRDDGFELKVLLKRTKDDFKFDIIKEKNSPRIFISHTSTTLPLDTTLTGNSESTKKSIEKLLAY